MSVHDVDTVIIGAGQAGLALSYELRSARIDHLVLERNRIGHSWRSQRWDSFRLNTPAWMNLLPGAPDPVEPGAFAGAADFASSLERLAFRHRLPVHSGVEVEAVEHYPAVDCFLIATSAGPIVARNVVVASGAARVPNLPAVHAALPDSIDQLHSSQYRNPAELEQGAVLVVGGGQSGVQIADELLGAGRRVFLATSRVGRMPRRHRGRDSLEWLRDSGFFDERRHEVLSAGGRPPRQFQISGADGGRTLSYQHLERRGAVLTGRLVGVDGSRLELGDDVARNAAFADRTSSEIKARMDAQIARADAFAPPRERDPADVPYAERALPSSPSSVDLGKEEIRTVIWATGLRADTAWLKLPVFDERGEIAHDEGVTAVPGLFATGQPWLRTRVSAMIHGAHRDAPHLAQLVMSRAARTERPAPLRPAVLAA